MSLRLFTSPRLPVLFFGAGTLLASLAGCPSETPLVRPPSPGAGTPRPSPSFIAPSTPPTGSYSDAGIEVLGGSLFIEVKTDGRPLAHATVKLYGPTMATALANSEGQVTLGPLAVGVGYRLVAEAPGFATAQEGNLEIKKKGITPLRVSLGHETVVTGRVVNGGRPVHGAVVSDGLNSALTGTDGEFRLKGVTPGEVTLTAGKSRFQTASKSISVTNPGDASLDLALDSAQPVIFFDSSIPSGVPLSKFSQLQAALAKDGWRISDRPPDREGVWVLVSPSQPLTAGVIERLVTFVAQGGKLVVFGEWGGFGSFQNPSVNTLTHAVGLHFNPDLVRDPASEPNGDWPSILVFPPDQLAVAQVSSVQFYQSCSLFGLAPMAGLAQTSAKSFRVQSNAVAGQQTVVAGGPYKGGKAIVLGDASAFSDEDTDGNGTSNLREADNYRLIEQLFNW